MPQLNCLIMSRLGNIEGFYDHEWTGFGQYELPMLRGDQIRLLQVLVNLTKNALKFTKKGHICINACYDKRAKKLAVQIKDTGIGISQEQ